MKVPTPDFVEIELDALIKRIEEHSPYFGHENVVAIIADHADKRALEIFKDRLGWKEELTRSTLDE